MPRILLYIAGAALLGFVLSQRYLTPKTWEPFYEACMSGGTALERQCRCLSDFVHDRLSEEEILAIMEDRVVDKEFQDRVARTIKVGSRHCR